METIRAGKVRTQTDTEHPSITGERKSEEFHNHESYDRKKKLGNFFFIIGVLACPCHLPALFLVITMALSGTTIGLFLSNSLSIVFLLSVLVFIGGSITGYYLLKKAEESSSIFCRACSSVQVDTGSS